MFFRIKWIEVRIDRFLDWVEELRWDFARDGIPAERSKNASGQEGLDWV